jgi:hypothetical protein
VKICEVTFDETMICSVHIFESAGNQEIGESIFVEENEKDADWGDAEPTSLAAPIKSVPTTSAHGPDPSSFTTWGPTEEPQLLLRGLLREKHLDTFSVATHLRP